MRSTLILVLLLSTLANDALAVDGVLEINQICAVQTGCFSGDTAGFPVTIVSPGGYRLTSNLGLPSSNTDAIVVSTSSVSIDLGGFEIAGTVTCSGTPLVCSPVSGTGSGVKRAVATNLGISVMNGSITGMGSHGVWLGGAAEVANLRVRWNAYRGIYAGAGSTVVGNTAYQNGETGIVADNGSTVSGNAAFENASEGIVASVGVTVVGNTANQNGTVGISAASGSTVSSNTAFRNVGDGISVGGGSTVSNNTVQQNGNEGISASSGVTLIGNTAYDNGDATFPTTDHGISCNFGCIVRGNTVRLNGGFGLSLGTDSAYSDNVVTGNTTGTVTGTGSPNGRGGNYCAGTGVVSANCP